MKRALAIVGVIGIGLAVAATVGSVRSNDRQTSASTPCRVGHTVEMAGKEWKCTFVEEFEGQSLDPRKWLVQKTSVSGSRSGEECFVGPGKNVAVSGGYLNLTAMREAAPFTCASPLGHYRTQYSSGMVSTWKRFSQTYGRFEIRARFPAAKVAGLHSALWLYPQDLTYGAWPRSGEIDIAEVYSNYPDRAIPYIHYQQPPKDPRATNNWCSIKDISAFHVYVAVWTPSTITITYDGKKCLEHKWKPAGLLKEGAPFDKPFFVSLSQTLGINKNVFNPALTPLPATTQVDYVRVWS